MSFEIRLVDESDTVVEVPNHQEGGRVALGGVTEAEMSVTYNYSYFYYKEIDSDEGFRWLNGKQASETVEVLKEAIETLGDEPHRDCENYWCPSMGNAGAALSTLLDWANQHPDAEWEVW